jgi:hypothetical protein
VLLGKSTSLILFPFFFFLPLPLCCHISLSAFARVPRTIFSLAQSTVTWDLIVQPHLLPASGFSFRNSHRHSLLSHNNNNNNNTKTATIYST